MRTFKLIRRRDVSGVSGTGTVAQGVEFNDGKVAMRWLGKYRTTEIAHDIQTIIEIHGHDGATVVEWERDA